LVKSITVIVRFNSTKFQRNFWWVETNAKMHETFLRNVLWVLIAPFYPQNVPTAQRKKV